MTVDRHAKIRFHVRALSVPVQRPGDGKSLSASEVSKGALALKGCSVKRGSSVGANAPAGASVNTPFSPPRTSETAGFSRFEKASIRVQTVMLAMTPQTPPKWVQNSVFYDILNTFSPPGCLRYIVFYEVLLHISESRPRAPKTPRDSPRTSARPPRDAPRTPPESSKLVGFSSSGKAL